MSSSARGVIIFISVLLTIGIWAPLRNRPERLPDGTVVTETYFGVFTYGTLTSRLKEPHYQMDFAHHPKSTAATAATTIALWAVVFLLVRKKDEPAASN
ncbi:MAG TPA: hypothetical protein VF773_06900 [Verrucomicrobiae bacterium]